MVETVTQEELQSGIEVEGIKEGYESLTSIECRRGSIKSRELSTILVGVLTLLCSARKLVRQPTTHTSSLRKA